MDAYLQAYPPPGTNVNGVIWGGAPPVANPVDYNVERGGNPVPEMAGLDYWRQFYDQGPANVQMPQYQTANQDQARLQQDRVIQDLQRSAAGDMNSQAQQQLRQQYGAARSQQASLGSSIRGQGAGATQRSIQQGQQDIQRGFAGDRQMLMLQEQQAAQQMLAQLYSQQQGQDISQAQAMAQSQLSGQNLDQMMTKFYAQGGLQAALAREQMSREQAMGRLGVTMDYANLQNDMINRGIQSGASALATGAQAWGSGGSNGSTYQSNPNHGTSEGH